MEHQPPPPILTIQSGGQAGHAFVIQEGVNRVGRHHDNEIVLRDEAVAPYHARIVRQPEGIWIQDLGSATGTFVNGQRLTNSVWLQPGDTLQLGPAVIMGLQFSQPGFASPTAVPHRPRRTYSWIIGTAILSLIVLGIIGLMLRFFFAPAIVTANTMVGPAIQLFAPEADARAIFNTPLFIHANARDERGVRRVELWVNGEKIAAKNSPQPEGITPFTFVPGWAPLATGEHTLLVRAYSSDARHSDSNARGVNAWPVSVEGDQIVHIAQAGDTVVTLAEKFETSVETIILNNVPIEENVSTEVIILPEGAPIVLPAGANPRAASPPSPPQNPSSPSEPPPDLANQSDNPQELDNSHEPPRPPFRCSSFLPQPERQWLLNVGISGHPSEESYCHITMGSRTRSKVLWHQKLSEAPFEIFWPEPSGSVPLQFSCLVEGRPSDKTPLALGKATAILNQDNWFGQHSQPLRPGASNEAFGAQISYSLRPADGLPPEALPELPRPVDLRQVPLWACSLAPPDYVAACLEGRILTWRWQPSPGVQDQPACFEVRQKIQRGEKILSEQITNINVLNPPVPDGGVTRWAALEQLDEHRLGCNTEVNYQVRVVRPGGDYAETQLLPSLSQGPPCQKNVSIEFRELRVSAAPGTGWERYGAIFAVNEEHVTWVGSPGLPPGEDNIYSIGRYLGDQQNILEVGVGDNDSLTVAAMISKIENGRWELSWCEGDLIFSRQQLRELPEQVEQVQTLNTRGGCQIEVAIKATSNTG